MTAKVHVSAGVDSYQTTLCGVPRDASLGECTDGEFSDTGTWWKQEYHYCPQCVRVFIYRCLVKNGDSSSV
jgi:hypothetical protein